MFNNVGNICWARGYMFQQCWQHLLGAWLHVPTLLATFVGCAATCFNIVGNSCWVRGYMFQHCWQHFVGCTATRSNIVGQHGCTATCHACNNTENNTPKIVAKRAKHSNKTLGKMFDKKRLNPTFIKQKMLLNRHPRWGAKCYNTVGLQTLERLVSSSLEI